MTGHRCHGADDAPRFPGEITDRVQDHYESLQQIYFDLHRNLEISLHKKQTSKRLAAEFRELGFEVTEKVGGYGVVGVMRNGQGPTVMIRTDMDALPIKEETDVDYASKTQTIVMLQTVVSREIPPVEPAVITVGSIHGGTKHNIIPDEVKLQLTVRSYSDEVRKLLLSSIKRVSEGVAKAAGVPDKLKPIVLVRDQFTPSTFNSPKLVDRTIIVLRRLLGDAVVVRLPQKNMGRRFFVLRSR